MYRKHPNHTYGRKQKPSASNQAQSHYREVARLEILYGTGIEIWAGLGPVWQLLRPIFSCFHWQKYFFKNILDGENIFGIE